MVKEKRASVPTHETKGRELFERREYCPKSEDCQGANLVNESEQEWRSIAERYDTVAPSHSTYSQVLLDKAGADVNIYLDKWRITNSFKAVNLAGLDDEDVSCASLEGLAVHSPYPAALTDELDLIIGMTVWTWSRTGLPME